MSKLHIIYIPGLGDQKIKGQLFVTYLWKIWRVEAEIYRMHWYDDTKWEEKFNKLLNHIDTLHSEGKKIGLVGASAGGSAVINAYAARKDKISGVVCIAGKINDPDDIGQRYRKYNPSFVESAYKIPASLESLNASDRKRILSRYALYDPIVKKADSKISGAKNRHSPTVGHVFTIAFQITLGAPSFLRFLKKLIKSS
ncbi:MAG: alpha/beta hydrolase family protein [Candidatus Saccharimonadales bacterium]